jgi:DNA-binding MarR family transcriptional regulator
MRPLQSALDLCSLINYSSAGKFEFLPSPPKRAVVPDASQSHPSFVHVGIAFCQALRGTDGLSGRGLLGDLRPTLNCAAQMSATPAFLDDSRMRRLVGYRLAQAGAAANRLFNEHLGKPLALRRVDYTILVLVDANHDATNRQLARLLGLSMPYLTVTLDKLVEKGLLTRVPNTVDRRSSLLRLSKEGKRLVRKADVIAETMEGALFARLTQGEAAILLELLDKVASPRHPHAPATHPERGSAEPSIPSSTI